MSSPDHMTIPDGFVLGRTTPEFDQSSVPQGLLRAHRVAPGVWGRLVVHEGSLDFVFEDPDESESSVRATTVVAGASQIIPPDRPHRVIITGPVRFAVEFFNPG